MHLKFKKSTILKTALHRLWWRLSGSFLRIAINALNASYVGEIMRRRLLNITTSIPRGYV